MSLVNALGNLALDGTDATGVTPPAGGIGIRGWLSGLYEWVTGGQKTSANSASVVLASDQSTISAHIIGNTGNLLQINPDKSILARPSVGTYMGDAGVSGAVNVPAGATVRGYSAYAGAFTTATIAVPGITGTITIPISGQFSDNPDPGTMIGPVTFTFTSTVSYIVTWVL